MFLTMWSYHYFSIVISNIILNIYCNLHTLYCLRLVKLNILLKAVGRELICIKWCTLRQGVTEFSPGGLHEQRLGGSITESIVPKIGQPLFHARLVSSSSCGYPKSCCMLKNKTIKLRLVTVGITRITNHSIHHHILHRKDHKESQIHE